MPGLGGGVQGVVRRFAVALLILLCGAAGAADPAASQPAAASAVVPPGQVEVLHAGVPVKALNRTVATFHASYLGWSPTVRAALATERLQAMLDGDGPKQVTVQDRPDGAMVLVDGRLMFGISVDDSIDRTLEGARSDAQLAAAVLQQVIDEGRESRDLQATLRAAAVAAVATLVLAVLVWGLRRVRLAAQRWLEAKTLKHAEVLRIGGLQMVGGERLVQVERGILKLVYAAIILVLVYEWLGTTLAQFPYTRVWGEQLNGFLWGVVRRFLLAFVHAVPDLFAAALIFVIAHYTIKLMKRFFINVQTGVIKVAWMDAEVAPTTSRLCVAGVWLFALAMAYPYLPGVEHRCVQGGVGAGWLDDLAGRVEPRRARAPAA